MGLDGVEIILTVEETFGIAIPNEAAANMTTVQDMIDYVAEHVPTLPQERCQTQRIYHKLRRGFQSPIPALASDFRLQTKLKDVMHEDQWPRVWAAVRREVGEDFWPETIPWPGLLRRRGPATVRELAYYIAFGLPKPDVVHAEPWTKERIALEIRAIVTDQMGVASDFRQSAGFAKDLHVD